MLVNYIVQGGVDSWLFKFEAINYGRSPAEIRWISFEWLPLDPDEPLPEYPPYVSPQELTLVHRAWVPPNGKIPIGDFSAQSIANMIPGLYDQLKSGKKKLWLYGAVRYRDKISNEVRETQFCYWKSPAPGVGLVMGGPVGYNEVT
jgi:hypothetical protein